METYSFEAEYQDVVVHDWLSDSSAWETNIPQLLRQGEINSSTKATFWYLDKLGVWN